jgi:hypothetical protein
MITIKTAENGFVLTIIEEDEEPILTYVIEDQDTKEETIVNLLKYITNHLSPYSKRNALNVVSCMFPGYDHPNYESATCPVCQREPKPE